jgi:hypothetical protein
MKTMARSQSPTSLPGRNCGGSAIGPEPTSSVGSERRRDSGWLAVAARRNDPDRDPRERLLQVQDLRRRHPSAVPAAAVRASPVSPRSRGATRAVVRSNPDRHVYELHEFNEVSLAVLGWRYVEFVAGVQGKIRSVN